MDAPLGLTIDAPVTAISLRRRYLQAAIYSSIGNVLSRVFTGIVPIILARHLSTRDFGIYSLAMSFLYMLAGLSPLGQQTALQHFLPHYAVKDRERGGKLFANTVILVPSSILMLALSTFILSDAAARTIYHDPALAGVIRFATLLLLSAGLLNLGASAALGFQDTKAYSLSLIVRSVLLLGLSWFGVRVAGLYGALAAQLIAGAVAVVILAQAALRAARSRFSGSLRPSFDRTMLQETFSFAIPSVLAAILVSPANWWANTVLARSFGLEQVGIFGTCLLLSQIVVIVPSGLSAPAVSFLSEVHADRSRIRFSELTSMNIRLTWAVGLPVCFLCATAGPYMIPALFGQRYTVSSGAILAMSFSSLLTVITSGLGAGIMGAGRMWAFLGLTSIWLFCFVCLGSVLAPLMGALGLGLTYFASYLLSACAMWRYLSVRTCGPIVGLGSVALLTVTALVASVILVVCLPALRCASVGAVLTVALVGVEYLWVVDANERRAVARVLKLA